MATATGFAHEPSRPLGLWPVSSQHLGRQDHVAETRGSQRLVDLGDNVLAVVDIPLVEENLDVVIADALCLQACAKLAHSYLIRAGMAQKDILH